MLIKMVKGYYRGEHGLAAGDTVPTGPYHLVNDELAKTLIDEGYAKEVKPIPERATAPAAEQATGQPQRKQGG